MKIVATMSFASSRPPERRPLERRTLVPKCTRSAHNKIFGGTNMSMGGLKILWCGSQALLEGAAQRAAVEKRPLKGGRDKKKQKCSNFNLEFSKLSEWLITIRLHLRMAQLCQACFIFVKCKWKIILCKTFPMVNMAARSDIIRLLADILPFIVPVIAELSLTKIK